MSVSIDTAVHSCEVRKLVGGVTRAHSELTSVGPLHSVELMLDGSQSQQAVVIAVVGGRVRRSCLACRKVVVVLV